MSESNLEPNDPFRAAQEEWRQEGTRPEWLPEGSRDKESSEDQPAASGGRQSGGGLSSDRLKIKEKAATAAAGKIAAGVTGSKGVGGGVEKLFSGKGRPPLGGSSGKKAGGKKMALVMVLIIAVFGLAIVAVGAPMFMIGNLDYNLMNSLGFTGTVGILEKQAEYVTAEMAMDGEIPAEYANDLVAAGLDVGQVTAAGDFVRTNRYIANIEELDEVAVVGSGFYARGEDGELAFLFDGELIKASDFVAAVETNPRLYAAFSEGADISARYYYSKEVSDVYNEMGIVRNAYNAWQATGDETKDRESFNEVLVSVLDTDSVTGMAGCDDDYCSESSTASGNAETVVSNTGVIANGTGNAAQLLNSAITSEEPYKAARAFMAIEEPIQRTRIDGDGPANEVMNTLNEVATLTYTDVETGEQKTKKASILETPNFVAAVSGGKISKNEALNFSRDRALVAVGAGSELTSGTTISADGAASFSSATVRGGGSVDYDSLSKTVSSVSIATKEKNSDLFTSVVGGNRIVEGGSFLSSTINQRVLGAMPSDESTVVAYNREVNEVLARKAEAERATKSPFDISSPYTFFGSMLHGVATILVRNRVNSSNGVSLNAAVGVVADLANESTGGLFGDVKADGSSDKFLETFGNYCENVPSVGAVGDSYCTQITTVNTDYMGKTKGYWDDYIASHTQEYEDFALYGMDRNTTVGPNNAEVCKKYKERNGGIIEGAVDAISKLFGVYKECQGVNQSVATGSEYVMGGWNPDSDKVKKFSAYTLYDMVYSLLSKKQSTAAVILEDYYALHPVDKSRAGIVARRSGMTKEEAEMALVQADYLTEIAQYDASMRYVFGGSVEVKSPDKDILVEHSEKISGDLYCFWRGKNEYEDVRNRNFA